MLYVPLYSHKICSEHFLAHHMSQVPELLNNNSNNKNNNNNNNNPD